MATESVSNSSAEQMVAFAFMPQPCVVSKGGLSTQATNMAALDCDVVQNYDNYAISGHTLLLHTVKLCGSEAVTNVLLLKQAPWVKLSVEACTNLAFHANSVEECGRVVDAVGRIVAAGSCVRQVLKSSASPDTRTFRLTGIHADGSQGSVEISGPVTYSSRTEGVYFCLCLQACGVSDGAKRTGPIPQLLLSLFGKHPRKVPWSGLYFSTGNTRVTSGNVSDAAALLKMLRPSEKRVSACVKLFKAYQNIQRFPTTTALFIAITATLPDVYLFDFLASARFSTILHVV